MTQLKQNNLFDKYDDILDLKPTERVHSKNPVICNENHRQVYFTRNFSSLSPMRMIILPFLHERKLYINRIDRNHRYFYTVIEEGEALVCESAQEVQGAYTGEKRTLFVAMDFTVNHY
mmetsp:Transcript_8198/g.12570  ORF Transcript_8198/g.12570 Transcript_8198/m.12570 type:complete len:118 (+) Transcript_8198:3002-3355(+)